MYSKQEKDQALKLYEQCKSIRKVIQSLEYPNRQTLYRWVDTKNDSPKKNYQGKNIIIQPNTVFIHLIK